MTFERLAEAPLILYDAYHGNADPTTRRQLVEHAQRAGVTLQPVIDVEDMTAAIALASRGLGDTVVARAALQRRRGKRALGTVSFATPIYDTFAFIQRRGASLSPGTRIFVELVERRLATIGEGVLMHPTARGRVLTVGRYPRPTTSVACTVATASRPRSNGPDVPLVLARRQGHRTAVQPQRAGTSSAGRTVRIAKTCRPPWKSSRSYATAPLTGGHAKRRPVMDSAVVPAVVVFAPGVRAVWGAVVGGFTAAEVEPGSGSQVRSPSPATASAARRTCTSRTRRRQPPGADAKRPAASSAPMRCRRVSGLRRRRTPLPRRGAKHERSSKNSSRPLDGHGVRAGLDRRHGIQTGRRTADGSLGDSRRRLLDDPEDGRVVDRGAGPDGPRGGSAARARRASSGSTRTSSGLSVSVRDATSPSRNTVT